MRNLKPLSRFVFFFALACKRIFIKTHGIESRCVIGAENILFAGASMHHSARILQAGAVKGLSEFGFLLCLLSECLMSGTGLIHCMFWDKKRLEMNVVSES